MAVVAGSAPKGGKKKGPGLRRKKSRVALRIDMTPMVDIGFLLVIFFMCTTVFREPQAMEITLPPSKAEVKTAQSNVLSMRLTKDEKILWNISDQASQEVAFKDLEKLLLDQRKANILKNYPGGEAAEITAKWQANPSDTSFSRQIEDWSKLVILVKVHRECRYELVVDVMDAIQHTGMSRFSLVELSQEELDNLSKGVRPRR